MIDDFVISIHALDRFEERFPDIWVDDDETGRLIYEETMDALDAGRVASVPPIELSTYDLGRWGAGKARVAWVPDKSRGYVLIETESGQTVATVLEGQTPEEAKSRLYVTDKNLNWRDTKENGGPPED